MEPKSTIDFSKLKVMMLDDSRHFTGIMVEVLRAFGVRDVARHDNAKDALTNLMHYPFDVLFLDLELGKINGFDLIKAIRSRSDCQNRGVKIIVVSAHAEKQNVRRAIDSGADEFLAKPVAPINVYNRLVKVLADPRPYIRTEDGYFGPERRRVVDPNFHGEDRRKTDVRDVVELD